jgi:septal ring factor EnvC (AmiA/AmiB activator)
VTPKKKSTKSTSKTCKGYNCNEVERYLDRAVHDVKGELLPRIELIDQRNMQYVDSARKAMADTVTLIDRQNSVEKQVSHLTHSVDSLHSKFDSHVREENREWGTIKEQLDVAAKDVAAVQRTINTVSANGNHGLHASLKELYNKHLEVHHDIKELKTSIDSFQKYIEPSLRWHDLRVSASNVWKSSALFKIFNTRLGTFFAVAIPVIVIAGIVYIFYPDPTGRVTSAVIAFLGIVFGLLKKSVSE